MEEIKLKVFKIQRNSYYVLIESETSEEIIEIPLDNQKLNKKGVLSDNLLSYSESFVRKAVNTLKNKYDEYKQKTLTTSSNMTREWLSIVRKKLEDKNSNIFYREKERWAKFISSDEDRVIAWIRANKKSLRLFLKLDHSVYDDLDKSPCTKNWEKSYPSVYEINSAEQLNRAIELILESYFYDLTE